MSGRIVPNALFFFVNAEIERREILGSDFIANQGGSVDFGESRDGRRDETRNIMRDVYGYDTG